GGWTLAIKGTLVNSYEEMMNRDLVTNNGFIRSFNRLNFTDVLVKMGHLDDTETWASFHGVADGNQTLDERIRSCCAGNYQVNYNSDAPHPVTNRSPNLAGHSETEALSFRMSQTAGPNDAMFFVVTRSSRDAANGYNPRERRYVNRDDVSVLLGFGENNYNWENWTSRGDWRADCGYAGYSDGNTGGCTSLGGVFVR
ncbi:MAG TPA: hypothetical protein DEB46_00215, partial [Myxococcales bacterium]|nr:hypothetical protein [Myxococcales bacterium]